MVDAASEETPRAGSRSDVRDIVSIEIFKFILLLKNFRAFEAEGGEGVGRAAAAASHSLCRSHSAPGSARLARRTRLGGIHSPGAGAGGTRGADRD